LEIVARAKDGPADTRLETSRASGVGCAIPPRSILTESGKGASQQIGR
jgi:hypothetical protein